MWVLSFSTLTNNTLSIYTAGRWELINEYWYNLLCQLKIYIYLIFFLLTV